MYLSAKGEYGILAALDLALSRESAPVQAKAIAHRQGIPIKFLEHILRTLLNAGLVASSRGTHGGYRLTKPADEIALGDLIQAVAGPIATTHCSHGSRTRSNGAESDASHESLIQTVGPEVQSSILAICNVV